MGKAANNDEKVDTLFDTIIFDINDEEKVKETNVIKEKNEIVDFTNPVEVVSEESITKKKKNDLKGAKKKKKNGPLSKFKNWFTALPKIRKIIFIGVIILVLLASLIVFLLLNKKDDDKKEKGPDFVLTADNYRYKNGVLTFLGENDSELGTYKCKNVNEKKCFVAYQSNEDDFTGDLYLNQNNEKIERRANIINDDYVFIVDNKKGSKDDIILYSIKSKTPVEHYKLVKESKINKNVVALKDKDNKYGLIDLSGETPNILINFVYDYLGLIESEMASKYAVVLKGSKYYVTDFSENLLSSGFNDKIAEYNDNFIVTKDAESKYQIYDYEGHLLRNDKYLFIKLAGNYYAALADNGIIVYNKEGDKLNESPIGLSSSNYNRTYIFDANNQLISNDIAFEINVNEDNVVVTRGKANDTLSLKEVEANKTRKLTSYYNGILYFYTDETKANILGKYTCKNRNTSGQFDRCLIASSVNFSNNDFTSNTPKGQTTLFNNRYVFIKDSVSIGGIYLYDLKASMKKGPYTDIDVFDAVSQEEVSTDINGAYVIAKNTKGEMGLLKVNVDSVDTVLGFEYSEIEKERDYFLVKKSNGNYALYKNDGKPLTSDIPGKIVSYNENYVAVRKENGYKVYKHNGEVVNDQGLFNYVKLENTFFVGIKDGKLGIYEYTDKKQENKALDYNIQIKSSSDYARENFFKVTYITKDTYRVSITDGEHNAEYMVTPKETIVPDQSVSQSNL